MSLYVLDTDVLSLYERKHPVLSPRIDAVDAGQLAITVISVEEQLSGWYTLVRQARDIPRLVQAYQRLGGCIPLLARFRILPLTELGIDRYDALAALKLKVGKNDLRIAAITLEHGGILVTRNLHDFARVPGLSVEDWSV